MRKVADSVFSVDFPDVPRCVTAASSPYDASLTAGKALRRHIAGVVDGRRPIPVPSTLDDTMRDPQHRDGIAILVDAPWQAPSAVRVNLMLPDDLPREIDEVARTRSRFLTEAALAKLRHDAA